LMGLTHRAVDVEGSAGNDPPAEQSAQWTKWWDANGSSAKVYGPRECGEIEKLP